MDKYEIIRKIENFAPIETQQEWDCSGWGVNVDGFDEIHKIMLCLTVTQDVVFQAKAEKCDMILSHHPLFSVPIEWGDINIYSAHTNLDIAQGGTTDVLAKLFGDDIKSFGFLRVIDKKMSVKEFSQKIKQISPNARIVNNQGVTEISKIAFCAGSGAEFINDAISLGADCFVTGDLKFHAALDSSIVLYDIGHFESEIIVLPVFEKLIGDGVEIVYAKEHSPFEMV